MQPEELIEAVRKYPVLYDQSMEQYRNAEYKELIWKAVARELNAEGQQEECKKKWASIRDSFRRARQKRKTKSGQAAISITKYKYESVLEFLIPHLAERKGLSNVPDDEGEEDDDACDTGNGSQRPAHDPQQPDACNTEPQGSIESSQSSSGKTPTNRGSAENRTSYAGRKRKIERSEMRSSESPSSQLMAYILAEKQAEKANSQQSNPPTPPELHPVDAFLAGIATSLKALDPERLLAAKGRIFNLVQEFELDQLRENRQLRSDMGGPWMTHQSSSVQTSCGSTPSNTAEDRDQDISYFHMQ